MTPNPERSTNSAVVAHENADRIDDDRLESNLGTDADAIAFDRRGAAVLVEAEYEGTVDN